MKTDDLILIKTFLFKTFLTGLFFAVLIFTLTFIFWDRWSLIVISKFQVAPKDLGELFVNSMLFTRFYLIFVILAPAIALHCITKNKKAEKD